MSLLGSSGLSCSRFLGVGCRVENSRACEAVNVVTMRHRSGAAPTASARKSSLDSHDGDSAVAATTSIKAAPSSGAMSV